MSNKTKGGKVCSAKKTSIGGQALIEGIMMRGPKNNCMAVRNPEGEIIVEHSDVTASSVPGFFRWPFLRGIFGFIDSMKTGYKCLMRSAEIAGFDDIDEEKKNVGNIDTDERETVTDENVMAENANEILQSDTKSDESKKKDSEVKPWVMNTIMIISSILGVALALILFKALPEAVYGLFLKLVPSLDGKTGYGYSLLRAAFVGVIKIIILVAYMMLVSLMKDIKRTFMYHGAEHKSIMCYENGLELTVENVREQKRFHPRCGTSFLIVMVLVGIFITMFIPTTLHDNEAINVVLRTAIGLALLPVIMSIGYELIKLAGKYDNWFTRIISAPGMWLQRITTREPDDGMIECAIIALKAVIPDDGSDDWNKK